MKVRSISGAISCQMSGRMISAAFPSAAGWRAQERRIGVVVEDVAFCKASRARLIQWGTRKAFGATSEQMSVRDVVRTVFDHVTHD